MSASLNTLSSSAEEMPVVFIGIDLAWSPRRQSGAAVVIGDAQGGRLLAPPQLLGDDRAIVDYIARHGGSGPAVVTVDAPLLVPNQHGRRMAEAAIDAAFRVYEAGAHPANRRLLSYDGNIRGETLVAHLRELGFSYSDRIDAGERRRIVVEVFPHPAMVALFGLPRTLKYKARPQRPIELRHAEWRRYQRYLIELTRADPPLHGHQALLELDPASLGPGALKGYEDRIDALFCAYIGLYAARWGATRCRVFGNLEQGSIFTPVPEALRA